MRIWVDGQCFQTASRDRGIGRYALSLLYELVKQNPEVEFVVSLNANLAPEAYTARKLLRDFLPDQAIRVWQAGDIKPEVVSGYDDARRFSEVALHHHVAMIRPDVILSASPHEGVNDLASPFNPFLGRIAPLAQIFYDAIPDRFPEQYLSDPSFRKAYSRRKEFYNHCDLILSISDFTDAEARHFFDGVATKPIYAGVSQSFLNLKKSVKPAKAIDIDFLYVGAADFRKNITGLVHAISVIALKHGVQKNLSVVGSYHQCGRDEVNQLWKSEGLDPALISFHGRVSDENLIRFYNRSKVVVQPSLMEGFGLTALEGIFAGACVAGSRDTALEEIVLDERALFEPRDPVDMADVLFELSENDRLRKHVIRRQKASLKAFTWQRSAALAAGYLREIAGGGNEHNTETDDIRSKTLSILRKSGSLKDASSAARMLAANEPMDEWHRPRLAIDATSTTRIDHKTGIQRVVNKILQRSLLSAHEVNHDLAVLYCDDWDGWFDMGQAIPKEAEKTNFFAARPADTLLLLDSSWEFYGQQKDALWDARLKGCDVISCLYDTVPLRHSVFCDPGMPIIFSQWFRAALTYSAGFVCISKAVADELHAILNAIHFPHPMKIGYWPLGADFGDGRATAPAAPRTTRRDNDKAPSVFLMVGTLESRKGHAVALEAFERLWAEGVNAQLVIVGKKGWGIAHLLKKIETHPELGKRLIWKSAVEDDELSDLYRRCDALLACSYAEGFGLPIVEAGQMGKPVIASDISVFKEVGRSAPQTHFFPVGSASGLVEAIKTFRDTTAETERSVTHWPTWQESADRLARLVTGEDWYIRYEPRQDTLSLDVNDIGEFVVRRPLNGDDTEHELAISGAPTPSDDGVFVQYVVSVTNRSSVTWSSFTDERCQFPVRLGYRMANGNGDLTPEEFPRTEIPFIIAPGETSYLPINVDWKAIPADASEISIQIVQDGVSWWGSGIRVPLPRMAENYNSGS